MKFTKLLPAILTITLMTFSNLFSPISYAAELRDNQITIDEFNNTFTPTEQGSTNNDDKSNESASISDNETTNDYYASDEFTTPDLDFSDKEKDYTDDESLEESEKLEEGEELEGLEESEKLEKTEDDSDIDSKGFSSISIKLYEWQYYYVEVDGYKFAIEDEGDFVVKEDIEMSCEEQISFNDFFAEGFVDNDLEGTLLTYSEDISTVISMLRSHGEISSDTVVEIYIKDNTLEDYSLTF